MGQASELRDGRAYRRRDGRILEAVIALADAGDADGQAWQRAWARFFKTLLDLGWIAPARRTHALEARIAELERQAQQLQAAGAFAEWVLRPVAARIAGCSVSTLRSWQRAGLLSRGPHGRVAVAELRAFLASTRAKGFLACTRVRNPTEKVGRISHAARRLETR